MKTWSNLATIEGTRPNNVVKIPVALSAIRFLRRRTGGFLQLGRPIYIGEQGGQSFKFGACLGIGNLGTSGDVKFTETTQQIHNINIGGIGTAITTLMGYRYHYWYARAVEGPYFYTF